MIFSNINCIVELDDLLADFFTHARLSQTYKRDDSENGWETSYPTEHFTAC